MKKYLLPEKGTFYKANLHIHSSVSDGRRTPEELKQAYMERGYSIIAYTDHNVMIPHDDLTDENFLALTGYEIDLAEDFTVVGFPNVKACHICLISLDKNNKKQVCWHRSEYLTVNAPLYRDKVEFYEDEPDFVRTYSVECVNEIMRRGREAGFFVTYNHPKWSMETYDQYMQYENMHAMEIYNNMSFIEGHGDYNPDVYDNMLRGGKRIFCTATDDAHSVHPFDSPYNDCFGGFTMIKADELSYEAIAKALVNGDFYASQGPEIYELTYDNGEVNIKCAPSATIVLSTARRSVQTVRAAENEFVTEASFNVEDADGYFRLTVTDKCGKKAHTSAYFIDELK